MADIGSSVLARLKNKAAESGRSYQVCLQLFCQEDIYYLANRFDFDGNIMSSALAKTFENRNHSFTIEQFNRIMTFGTGEGMQKKWKAFAKKINTEIDDFKTIIETLELFVAEPFRAVLENKNYTMSWHAADCIWKL